jgi:hypothetical protein
MSVLRCIGGSGLEDVRYFRIRFEEKGRFLPFGAAVEGVEKPEER